MSEEEIERQQPTIHGVQVPSRRLVGLVGLDATDEEIDEFLAALNEGMPEAEASRIRDRNFGSRRQRR